MSIQVYITDGYIKQRGYVINNSESTESLELISLKIKYSTKTYNKQITSSFIGNVQNYYVRLDGDSETTIDKFYVRIYKNLTFINPKIYWQTEGC